MDQHKKNLKILQLLLFCGGFGFFISMFGCQATTEQREHEMGLFDKVFGRSEKTQQKQDKLNDISIPGKTSQMMDEQKFWNLIERSLQNSTNQDEQEPWLISELQKLSNEEIIGFRLRTDKLLYDTYTSEMWCAGFVMNGGCSDDGFEYFRCWIISRGENVYNEAKNNPDSLINEVVDGQVWYDVEFESFWYVALEAFERKTGKDLYDFIDYDNFTTREGNYPDIELNWQEDNPETMKRICPRLFEKFFE
jgi:hypothetical protein